MGKIKGWKKNVAISKASGSDVWYSDDYYAHKDTNKKRYFYPSIVVSQVWNGNQTKMIWSVTRIETPYRNSKKLFEGKTKKEAVAFAMNYMRSH